jgi:glycine/D-amino acid oxidase-like deaminating enzyme
MGSEWDAAIIGGGFFGCMTALALSRHGRRVVVLEKHDRLLGRASYHNQARIHNGYHYPRSLRTAASSRLNFPRFVRQFADCVDSSFAQYYAVARLFSKVTARQFRAFFDRLGAPLEPAPEAVRRLFNPDLVEDVFRVTEYAFDAARLGQRLQQQLAEAGVEVRYQTEAIRVSLRTDGRLLLRLVSQCGEDEVAAGEAYSCTYAQTNKLLAGSGLPLIPLQHELTEIALVEVPPPLRRAGVTLMCGPFFSVMPFPPRGLHSLSHVRYTPHDAWQDGDGPYRDAHAELVRRPRRSRFSWMMQDAARYLPLLRDCRQRDSLWEIKTILPRSAEDDSRPILFRAHHGLPNLHCVVGGKIDNVYDLIDELDRARPGERRSA